MALPGHWTPHGYRKPPPTQMQASTTSPDRTSNNESVSVEPAFIDTELITLQFLFPAINKMVLHLSEHSDKPYKLDFKSISDLKKLFTRSALRLVKFVLVHVSDALSSPVFVVPRNQTEVMLVDAYDLPSAGHKGVKATYNVLKQVAYWP